ncbi:filamentous hemagglutinin N-terminal domain-containing protein [Herminiimonas glaciei]|uniref:Filamentous hemagglutinin N-terminal domain-containing protein n=1 Tax=Herminiimonas glaciei TaxID=523788 RepID=A0ABW2I8J0_9BURK
MQDYHCSVRHIFREDKPQYRLSPAHRILAIFAGSVIAVATPLAWAAPADGVVTSGSGSISSSGNVTNIVQGSNKLAINWSSFNIASNETVNFIQPGRDAIALNRIIGSGATEIYGKLNANGQVFLLNPNGVLFGAGASVNVGGLLASTLNLSDADFNAGNYRFTSLGNSTAGIVNQGSITAANGGYVSLLGSQVSNQGTLVARLGNVTLAAGSDMTLDFAGDGLLSVKVNQGSLQALVQNKQLIQADGGTVVMHAKTADNLIQAVVNNDGMIQANAVDTRDGRVMLVSDNGQLQLNGGIRAQGGQVLADAGNGDTILQGRVDVSNATGKGGQVSLLGDRVALFGTAQVDASGRDGGGTVLIGGDFQGKNAAVRNASQTVVSAATQIDANATGKGDGGRVIVWSDGTTVAQGKINAKGGDSGGNGGFVEVSGKQTLNFNAQVDTRAALGTMGTLLLDPTDLDVVDCVNSCGFSLPVISFGDIPSGGQSTIRGATLSNATTNVSLQATNSINFYDPVAIAAAGKSLTAEAGNTINVYNSIYAPANVTLKAPSIYIASNVDAGSSVHLLADGLTISGGSGGFVAAPKVIIEPYSAGFGVSIGGLGLGNSLTLSTGSLSGINGNSALTLIGSNIELNTTLNRSGDTIMVASSSFSSSVANMSIGGRYLVYTADPTTSNRNGAGSYSKHYNVSYDGTTPDYADTGNWFFYSIAPTLQLTPTGGSIVYGNALPSGYTIDTGGLIDGDTLPTAGLSGTASFGVAAGNTSASGHLNVGSHALDYTGNLASSLGYQIVSNAGNVTVTPATLSVSGAIAQNKIYDGNTTATISSGMLNGLLAGDAVFLNQNGNFDSASIGTGKTVNLAFSLTGADQGNYILSNPSGNTLANISSNTQNTQALAWYQAAIKSTDRPDFVPTFTTQRSLNIVRQDTAATTRVHQTEQQSSDSSNDTAGKTDATNSVLTIIDGGV